VWIGVRELLNLAGGLKAVRRFLQNNEILTTELRSAHSMPSLNLKGSFQPVVVGLTVAVLSFAGLASARAQQQSETTWICTDKDGRKWATNVKDTTVGKDCKVVVQDRVTTVPSTKAKPSSPQNFPKESASDRTAAKDRQRTTLEKELSQEEALLADAKRKLSEQEQIRTGDEKNYARVQERLQPYKDAVEVHSKNIEALKRELANVYR